MKKIQPTRQSSKTVISKDEKMSVLGLLTLAQEHVKLCSEIEASIRKILGEKETMGHVGDSVWGFISGDTTPKSEVERLLNVLELKVK